MTTWSEEATARLRELWLSRSCTEIAATLYEEGYGEFSRHAVIGRLHRLGLSSKDKAFVHPHTRFDHVPRPLVPVSHQVGAEAFKIIHAIKRKAKEPGTKPLPLVCQPLPDIEPRNVSLLDLAHDECRWPTTDSLPHAFCGLQKSPGSSYCPAHLRMSRGEGTASERAAHRVVEAA